jgi:hypothetical protein
MASACRATAAAPRTTANALIHTFTAGLVLATDEPVGHVQLHRLLLARMTRSQHAQAHAGGDCRQPPADVLDLLHAGSVDAQPSFVQGVVHLGKPSIR